MPPPVITQPKLLPFHDPAFSWDSFEGFFCCFLAASPSLVGKDGLPCRVVTTSLYGRRGDSQHGIDIRAEMSNGEVWAFQCKHYKEWGPKDTADAIEKCTYPAARKFLLITRSVSPETREVVARHPEWVIWDAEDISREFFARLPAAEAARLLYVHFGPSWPRELLGFPGIGPLVTADAKFAPLLEEGRSFHHRLDLIGRQDVLKRLDDFVEAKRLRVTSLVGRGGLGKSRILREWSKAFTGRHPGWTLRFVSDSPADFGPTLDGTAKPLMLVFDDAHRLDEIRRALFAELPARQEIKLVLALRPGPTEQIDSELTDAGFDLTQIEKPIVLKPLKAAQTLELAEKALGPERAGPYRLRLRDLSRDCPLIAVLAAELIKRGELAERDFDDTREFQTIVFNGLLRDAEPVEKQFGKIRTLDLLRLLAMLAPLKPDTHFLSHAATFLGGETQPDHVRDILDAFDNAGLLVFTGAGVRITPDLLSDHLAYTACYDKQGGNTTFANRVLTQFNPDQLPRLLQHLAEAEWRAMQDNNAAESIVEPLWQWFAVRFETSSFQDRRTQIDQWANIAHLQPHRTLLLAQLALRLDTASLPEQALFRNERLDSHTYVLDGLPSMLKRLAETHPQHVAACLDILWKIGRDRTPPAFAGRNHPIKIIGEIASYQTWKSLDVHRAVLAWVENLLSSDDWLNRSNKPGWILEEVLGPFFATGVEDNWSSGRTAHFHSLPVHITNTIELRERVLVLCRSLAARRLTLLTLAVIEVLERAMDRARLSFGEAPAKLHQEWLPERRKALAVLDEIIRNSQVTIIHFRARQVLRHHIQFDDGAEFQEDCRQVYGRIPDTLELRVLRAALGNHGDEFERGDKPGDPERYESAKRRWEQFVRSTAEAMVEEWQDAAALLDRLAQWASELKPLDFQPNFGPLLQAVARSHPQRALELGRSLIVQPSHPHGALLDALILEPTKTDLEQRLVLCEQALVTGADELIVGAIGCLTWWRREAALPQRAWEMLAAAGRSASPRVAQSLIHFVWMNESEPMAADWELLASLSIPSDPPWLAGHLVARAAGLLRKPPLPAPQIVEGILAKLERCPSLQGHDIDHGLGEFAKHYPSKVFLLFWHRHQLEKAEGLNLGGLPFEFDELEFANVREDPEAAAAVRELEDRLLGDAEPDYYENRILQIAVLQDRERAEQHLLRLLERAFSPEQLIRLTHFVRNWNAWPVILSCPDFTRSLLQKAHSAGHETYAAVFDPLRLLSGTRAFTNGEPDEEGKALLAAAESMAHRYANDPLLGPLYAAAVAVEHSSIKESRRHARIQDEALDD